MWHTKEEASNKYPGVEFGGDVWVMDDVKIGAGAVIGGGVVISFLL